MTIRTFDLNIERVLEHWTVVHALREVIANALDEAALTRTSEPSITVDQTGAWHIRDWGRGLRYAHLTQNENREKLAHPESVVGKFGVGLKDAVATFDRHHITVLIRSQHSDIRIGKEHKHGFNDLSTLHAIIDEPSDPLLIGTDFVITGVSQTDIDLAKKLLLHYSADEQMESTSVGAVLRRRGNMAAIYVSGLKVAEEPNFLFSYNITAPTKILR